MLGFPGTFQLNATVPPQPRLQPGPLCLARPVQAAHGARADELPARHRPRRGQGDRAGVVAARRGRRLAPPSGCASPSANAQATQVVSQGRHHHNRWRVVSGLNTRAGWPQNRHSGPLFPRPSIHPTVLAVAACILSNRSLMVRLISASPVASSRRAPMPSRIALEWSGVVRVSARFRCRPPRAPRTPVAGRPLSRSVRFRPTCHPGSSIPPMESERRMVWSARS